MATLLSGVTTDGAGSGASHTGPCTVHVPDNVVWDGAYIIIEIADSDTAAEYTPVGDQTTNGGGRFQQGEQQPLNVNALGTYFIRAVVYGAGNATNLTCTTTQ